MYLCFYVYVYMYVYLLYMYTYSKYTYMYMHMYMYCVYLRTMYVRDFFSIKCMYMYAFSCMFLFNNMKMLVGRKGLVYSYV